MFRAAILALFGALVFAATGCGLGQPAPTSSPDPTPSVGSSPRPTPFGQIEHATGSNDVILRLEEGGGFVPPGALLTQAPLFTLYGDGTALFRSSKGEAPKADGTVVRERPFLTARLVPEQVQELLSFALVDGGLALARARYDDNTVADGPTTTFIIRAGGLDKTVHVYALGIAEGGSDAGIRTALNRLAERLRTFSSGRIEATAWRPDRFRAILFDPGPVQNARPIGWPWPAIPVSDFSSSQDPTLPSFPRRTLSGEEAAALDLSEIGGGVQGVFVRTPDGALTHLVLRPLLPDEVN